MRALIVRLVGVAAALIVGNGENIYGELLFSNTTDTISISGHTTIGTAATYEALIRLTGPYSSSGILYNEWGNQSSDKSLYVGLDVLAGFSWPVNSPTPMTAYPTVGIGTHHIAYVYDGAQEALYLDGSEILVRPANGSVANNPTASAIGAIFRDGAAQAGFTGYLDWLRISDTARYSGTTFSPPVTTPTGDANTQLLYDFGTPSGGTVADLSGNGHTGTLGTGFSGATSPLWVPEPSTFVLLAVGAVGLFAWRRRRQAA
jgi:hypothetical protein